MARVLVTGFEAFGTTPVNPADHVARMLDGEKIAGADVVACIAPNLFFGSIEAVKDAIATEQPDLVMMLGEYGGRAMVTVERLAHNLNDAGRYGLEDNDGRAPIDELTDPEGPVAYYATVPIRAMVKGMREAGLPADISDTPGTLCCNHLMYGILHHIASEGLPIRAGWIHLPHLPEVAALDHNLGHPSMSAENSAAAVRVGIEVALNREEDIHVPLPSRFQI